MKMFLIIILAIIIIIFCFFFIGFPKENKDIIWGVNFSDKHTSALGLDVKETYMALLEEMNVKNIKIAVHWDALEREMGEYNFSDLDWKIEKAKDYNARVFLVIGMKTPRWPECHVPSWAHKLEKEGQQDRILMKIKEVVKRYKENEVVWAFQVENEPFFEFGDCPWYDREFLKKEIDLVKSLTDKPVIISDSGEFSFWIKAARLSDIVGTTMYRKAWFKELKTYISYPFPPTFYNRRIYIINKLFKKDVICVEFQAEPWGPSLLYDSPLEEQAKTMDLEQFKKNIEFGKKTSFDKIYLWGAEWWYYMKIKHNQPEIWEEAKKLF